MPGTGLRVLAVEDDDQAALAVKRLLTLSGFTVEVVGSCVAARASIARRPPDAVILDINLPGESGESLLDDLFLAAPLCRILVWTGTVDPAVIDRVTQKAAVTVIRKPAKGVQFIIDALLPLRHRPPAPDAAPPEP